MDQSKNDLKINLDEQAEQKYPPNYQYLKNPGQDKPVQNNPQNKRTDTSSGILETMKGDIEKLQKLDPSLDTSKVKALGIMGHKIAPTPDQKARAQIIPNISTTLSTPTEPQTPVATQYNYNDPKEIKTKINKVGTVNPFINKDSESDNYQATEKENSNINISADEIYRPENDTLYRNERKLAGSEEKKGTSPIHTYTSDIADAVKSKHTSLAKISIAESDRKNKKATSEEKERLTGLGKNAIVIIISLILVFAGGSIGYYFLFLKPLPSPKNTQQISQPADIVQSEKQISLPITDINHSALIAAIQKSLATTSIRTGQLERIVFTNIIGASDQTITNAIPEDLFSLLQTKAPDSLIRSFDDNFYFGIYNDSSDGNGNEPFLIFTSDSYSDIAAGMLSWEPNMVNDLKNIFIDPQYVTNDQPYSTTTASSTQYSFQSAIVGNKDVRIVKNSQGKILLLYSLINNNTLIITPDQYTFQELLSRMIKSTFIR